MICIEICGKNNVQGQTDLQKAGTMTSTVHFVAETAGIIPNRSLGRIEDLEKEIRELEDNIELFHPKSFV